MAERVHIFGGGASWLQHPEARYWAAQRITGDHDCSAEAGMAQMYDELFGGDEVRVGAHMTYLLEHSSDPREYTERVIAACDLLRASKRTRH